MIDFNDDEEETVSRAADLLPQHLRKHFIRSVQNMCPSRPKQGDLHRMNRTVLSEYGVSARHYSYARAKKEINNEQPR
jgi:hypothetical protein